MYILQQHIQSKLFPYNKRLHLLFIHIVCNLYLIINSRLPGEIILMNKHVVGGQCFNNTISSLNFILVLLLTFLSCNGFQDLPLFQVLYVQIW